MRTYKLEDLINAETGEHYYRLTVHYPDSKILDTKGIYTQEFITEQEALDELGFVLQEWARLGYTITVEDKHA